MAGLRGLAGVGAEEPAGALAVWTAVLRFLGRSDDLLAVEPGYHAGDAFRDGVRIAGHLPVVQDAGGGLPVLDVATRCIVCSGTTGLSVDVPPPASAPEPLAGGSGLGTRHVKEHGCNVVASEKSASRVVGQLPERLTPPPIYVGQLPWRRWTQGERRL